MTDKERIQKTYKKIRAKYPDVINKEEIDDLAIKHDKRNVLIKSAVCFGIAILSAVAYILLLDVELLEEILYIFILISISGVFESIRTLGKYSKIERRYRPVIEVKNEGQLTRYKIIKDGGRMLKKAEYLFTLIKLPLSDKEDKYDGDHEYYFLFDIPNVEQRVKYRVRYDRYIDAVIGAEYFVAVTPNNDIAEVYQASNWTLDSELSVLLVAPDAAQQSQPVTAADVNNTVYDAQAYQPDEIQITDERPKTKKLLPILSMVLSVISFFIPMFIGLPAAIAGIVLSIVGLARQRRALSIIAMVVNIVLFLLFLFSMVLTFIMSMAG